MTRSSPSWNGLAITALAEASVALQEPELAQAARRCASALLALHVVDGRLRRASLGGVVGDSAAILEDHAMLATGLLALYQLTSDEAWLTAATDLLEIALGTSPTRTSPAAGSTPPTMPSAWYSGPPTHWTARRPRVRRRSPKRCSPPRTWSTARVQSATWQQRVTRCARFGAAGPGAALGRTLVGGRRSRGARTAADRGCLRRPRDRPCWPMRADWRPVGRSSSAARWIRRRCWPAGTEWPASTPLMCAVGRCATYR